MLLYNITLTQMEHLIQIPEIQLEVHVLISVDKFTHTSFTIRNTAQPQFSGGRANQASEAFHRVTGVTKSLSLLAATSTSLSLVNEAPYLMINRASAELIHKLMSSRFEHITRNSKCTTLQ